MNGAITLLFSFAILIALAIFVARLSIRSLGGTKAKFGYLIIFVWLFALSGLSFTGIVAALRMGWSAPAWAPLAQNGLLGLFEFSYLAIAVYGVLREPSDRKLRTLTRLPIIGALLGAYLGMRGAALAFAAVEIAILIILAKHRGTHQYLWRAHLKAFLPIPLVAMYALPSGAWFMGYFFWAIIFKISVVNAAVVKKTMLDYDESSDNQSEKLDENQDN